MKRGDLFRFKVGHDIARRQGFEWRGMKSAGVPELPGCLGIYLSTARPSRHCWSRGRRFQMAAPSEMRSPPHPPPREENCCFFTGELSTALICARREHGSQTHRRLGAGLTGESVFQTKQRRVIWTLYMGPVCQGANHQVPK